MVLNYDEGYLQNSTASMAVIEKLVSFVTRGKPSPTIVLNTVLTLLSTEVKQEKEINKKRNLSLFLQMTWDTN